MKIFLLILFSLFVIGCQENNTETSGVESEEVMEKSAVVEQENNESSLADDLATALENMYKDYTQNDVNTPPPPTTRLEY